MVTQEKNNKPRIIVAYDDVFHVYEGNKFYSPLSPNSGYYSSYYSDAFASILNIENVNIKDITNADKFVMFIKLDMVYFEQCIKRTHDYYNNDIDKLVGVIKDITTHVNRGNCMLFFDTCTWPMIPSLHKIGITKLYTILKFNGVTNFNNVVLITSAHKNNSEGYTGPFKVVFFEFFENALRIRHDRSINLEKKIQNFSTDTTNKRFLYLNHKEKSHRLYLFLKVFVEVPNFYDYFAASMCPGRNMFSKERDKVGNFSAFKEGVTDFFDDQIPSWFYNSTQEEFINRFSEATNAKHGSITTDIAPWASGDNWKSPKIQWTLDTQCWEKTGIYIGVETNYKYSAEHAKIGDDYLSLTEKTFKPLMMKVPFILYGQPFILKKLREYGYKTFSDFWDESYDDEISHVERAKKVANVIIKLTEMKDSDFLHLLKQTRDIVEYNYSLFNKRVPEKEVCDVIIKFYENVNG